MAIIAGTIVLGPAVAAQTAQNVVTEAADAFGERIGIERIGLYNESQVRGFSLAEAGNYRIDGAYFVRAAALGNPVAAGVTTRVGFNALSADFPAPSGIVDTRLRTATSTRLDVEAGVIEYGGNYINIAGQAVSEDGRLRLAGGAQLQPNRRSPSGIHGEIYDYGLVPEWRISEATSLTGLVSYGTNQYPGDFVVIATGPTLPPKLHFPRKYGASWGNWYAETFTAGLIGRTRIGPWQLQASGFRSRADYPRSDYTLYNSGPDGTGRATGLYARPRSSVSDSGELKVGRSVGPGQRAYAMLRLRRSESHTRPSISVDLGPVDQRYPTPPTPAPVVTPADPTIDIVHQFTIGAGYEAQVSDALRLRGGVQRTRYRKAVAVPGQPLNANEENSWLYDASAVLALGRDWTAFATATRGLEESGSAPANAANRYQVLPAVIARQYELGFRGRIGSGLSLIGSAFEISKPTPGLDPVGIYRLVGEERHRGVELSLTGRVTPRLTAVAGVVALEPKLSGELVRLGRQDDRPVGVSSVVAVASFNYEPKALAGLSIDGQATYNGSRLVSPTSGLEAPDYVLFDLGGRYRFALADSDAVLRVYLSNIFAHNDWIPSRSGSLIRTSPRALRATLSVAFD